MASHFLTEVARAGAVFGLRIERTGAWLATALELAGDSRTRTRGLLDHESLAPGAGLVIAPSQGVHTFGMRFALDLVGVARDGRVVKCRPHVPPRRIVLALKAFAIVELEAGAVGRAGVKVGDVVRAEVCTSTG